MRGGRQALGWLAAAWLAVGATGCDDAGNEAVNLTSATSATTTAATANHVNVAGIDVSLARTHLCLACHQVDRQLVGPSFLAIAQRYAGSDGALDYLAASIRAGSQGRWGVLTMPQQPQVSAADARRLAQWLLDFSPTNTADSGADKPTE